MVFIWSHSVSLVSIGLTWCRSFLAWFSLASVLVSLGLTWFSLGHTWFSLYLTWSHLVSLASHLVSLGLLWFSCGPLGLNWSQRVSIGLNGFRLVSLRSPLIPLGLSSVSLCPTRQKVKDPKAKEKRETALRPTKHPDCAHAGTHARAARHETVSRLDSLPINAFFS